MLFAFEDGIKNSAVRLGIDMEVRYLDDDDNRMGLRLGEGEPFIIIPFYALKDEEKYKTAWGWKERHGKVRYGVYDFPDTEQALSLAYMLNGIHIPYKGDSW